VSDEKDGKKIAHIASVFESKGRSRSRKRKTSKAELSHSMTRFAKHLYDKMSTHKFSHLVWMISWNVSDVTKVK
jgi:hypothetical protein